MKVARLHGVRDLRLSQEPVPVGGEDTALVRVTAVGVCGSDLHWWGEGEIGDAVLEHPLVLGHEAAGVIEDGARRGQRVAIDPAIPCWACPPCRAGYRNLCTRVRFAGHGVTDGAMRDFMTWPQELLHPLPDQLTSADGAVLEPLGVAIHAMDLGHVRLGASVAVVGLGPIGLLLAQVLRAAGAGRVIGFDPLPHRREAAERLGVDLAASPVEAMSLAELRGLIAGVAGGEEEMEEVDVAFEMAGTDAAVQLAMAATRPGGRVVLAGIPASDETAFRASVARRKGLTIAMARRMNEVYPRAIALAVSGRVDLGAVVTHRYPLTQAAEGFAVAAGRAGLKVVIEPGG